MKNPQGHYSIDYFYYKALQAVARAYGLSYSDYVARLLIPVIKSELMNLDMPLERIFDKADLIMFAAREVKEDYEEVLCSSPFLVEDEVLHSAFKQYVYQKYMEFKSPPAQEKVTNSVRGGVRIPEKYVNPTAKINAIPNEMLNSEVSDVQSVRELEKDVESFNSSSSTPTFKPPTPVHFETAPMGVNSPQPYLPPTSQPVPEPDFQTAHFERVQPQTVPQVPQQPTVNHGQTLPQEQGSTYVPQAHSSDVTTAQEAQKQTKKKPKIGKLL